MLKNLISTWRYTCPRCHNSDLFEKPFRIKDPLAMHERCSSCDLNYTPEPGYYYGALFVSYIFSSALFLGIAGIAILVFGLSVNQAMLIVLVVYILTYFMTMRLARSIFIHFDIKYDKSKGNKNTSNRI